MTEIMIPESAITAAGRLKILAGDILDRARGIEITGEPMQALAFEWLATARKAVKDAEEQRKALTGPLREQIDVITRLFADVMAPVQAADEAITRKLKDYQALLRCWTEALQEDADWTRARAARLAAEAQAATQAVVRADTLSEFLERNDAADSAVAEAKAAAVAAETKPAYVAPPPKSVQMSRGTGSIKDVWTYRITNPDAVPREFCRPDPALLRAAVNRGVRTIAGVEITPDSQVAVRPR